MGRKPESGPRPRGLSRKSRRPRKRTRSSRRSRAAAASAVNRTRAGAESGPNADAPGRRRPRLGVGRRVRRTYLMSNTGQRNERSVRRTGSGGCGRLTVQLGASTVKFDKNEKQNLTDDVALNQKKQCTSVKPTKTCIRFVCIQLLYFNR